MLQKIVHFKDYIGVKVMNLRSKDRYRDNDDANKMTKTLTMTKRVDANDEDAMAMIMWVTTENSLSQMRQFKGTSYTRGRPLFRRAFKELIGREPVFQKGKVPMT